MWGMRRGSLKLGNRIVMNQFVRHDETLLKSRHVLQEMSRGFVNYATLLHNLLFFNWPHSASDIISNHKNMKGDAQRDWIKRRHHIMWLTCFLFPFSSRIHKSRVTATVFKKGFVFLSFLDCRQMEYFTSCMMRLINRKWSWWVILNIHPHQPTQLYFPFSFSLSPLNFWILMMLENDDEHPHLLFVVKIRKFPNAINLAPSFSSFLCHSSFIVAKVLVLSFTIFDVMSHIDGYDEK